MARPRAQKVALRIVAKPWDGYLYQDEFYSVEEWYRKQLRMRQYRESKARRRQRETPGSPKPSAGGSQA